MASWKEKGEVPDSDDEDEDDSQGLPNEGRGQGLLQEPRYVQKMHTGDASGDSVPRPLQSTSKQPSLSPRVFKEPPALLDLDRVREPQDSSSQNLPHADDDISQSYVKLSSSLSSLATPPAQIQQLCDAAAIDEREAHNSTSADDFPFRNGSEDLGSEKEMEMLGDDEFPSTTRWSLRQRNPIQLHPYALEGEKYRRTLIARGMRPLRLAQIQNDSRDIARDQSSPDSDFEAENESQILSFEDALPPSQTSQSSIAVGSPAAASPDRPSTQSGGEDDEFPDIDQLLDRSNEQCVQAGPKRRKTAYGSRYMSRIPPGLPLPRAAPNRSTTSKEPEMFDIPPSPPETSSPMPVFHGPFSDKRSKYVTSNFTSSRAVSLEYITSETAAAAGNLPTPATNLVKHTIDLTVEGQGDEDTFSSDSDSSLTSQCSEVDQSLQVRRVGKKIRGVLPASWLRLDQQTRQDKITKSSHREHRSLSPIRAALSRRGVALPKIFINENSPIAAQVNNDSHFILSDSEEEDAPSVSGVSGFVEESPINMFPDSMFSQTDIGSAMEDDRVDAMLPSHNASKSRVRASKITISVARPAQLETSVTEYKNRHPSVAFGSTKKVLDTLYRKAHKEKGNKGRGDVQLARFFGDKPPPSRADTPVIIDETQGSPTSLSKRSGPVKSARRQKRVPNHVDANVAVFRQSREPLILDLLQVAPETDEIYGHNGKLYGLGKFGTSYTNHFDVFPLQSEIFFDKSTFIGSGRLSNALKFPLDQCFDGDRGYIEIELGGKQLRWGLWNDTVSSEVGMCFDLIIEQLDDFNSKSSDVDEVALIKCITHVIDYFQNCLSFPDSASHGECVLRVIEVLSCFAGHLEALARGSDLGTEKLRIFIELSCRVIVLIFQLLRVAQCDSKGLAMVPQLESLMHKAALLTVSLLLLLGLAPIRDLYDDLQYMAYREAGIQCDRYAAQAWVILMHTLHVAQIPRVSFWDVVNSQLVTDDDAQTNDARVLERVWYDMFSLLPLTDFDMNGTLVPSVRLSRPFENWALPQKMVKKIFELYNSKSRQSPSFNDYCRALFSRCGYLMQIWGWRRHGIIVGTLFDFFATRNLANLRNEEVYKSPRFLEELDKDPSLALDPGDRCFHILLKIVAISIKQMREVGDTRGIRNLVARVLPNHDRQYPKEKTVRLRDLASLRNHHDLLCTLFWAAPPELRPPISLIRELVNPGSSHQEAYLINLRSWENLTQFVLAFTPTPTAYLPLATWQNESFTQLLTQYESIEEDIEDELRRLPPTAKQLISQHTLAATIKENKNNLAMALVQSLRSLTRCMERFKNVEIVKLVVNSIPAINAITCGLGLLKYRHDDDIPIAEAALDIVYCYVTQLLESGLLSDVSDVHNHTVEDDSQEFGSDVFTDVPIEIFEYIGHLNGGIMAGIRELLRTSLFSGHPIQQSFRDKIVETWALVAATLVLAKYYPLSDFLANSGPFYELSIAHENHAVRHCAPRFLAILSRVLGDKLHLESTGRDLLSDWLCMLINPIACFGFEHELLPVFAKYEVLISQAISTFQCRKTAVKADLFTIDGIKSGRTDLIHDILKTMAFVLQAVPSEKPRFQKIIRSMLCQMKADLGALGLRSLEAQTHQQFVTLVHSSLTTFFPDVSKTDLEDEFFSATSTYPADDNSFNDSTKFCEIVWSREAFRKGFVG